MSDHGFTPFPKIPRLRRDVVVTEKIDGTNAQIVIRDCQDSLALLTPHVATYNGMNLFAGSRSRWIQPGKATDNFGFAAWVRDNAEELCKLGVGQHFGEWYGQGIQRGYGLTERRFALFNTERWHVDNPSMPACCEVVPVLHRGATLDEADCAELLREGGSIAVPGYMNPEGIVVWHSAARQYFKVLLENDHLPKGAQ